MSGTRLVPAGPAAPFPYDEAKRLLLAMPRMSVGKVDFGRQIEVGKRLGWSKEMLDGHAGLLARGRCFTFRQDQPPWLRGTFYEANVWFEFDDQKQEETMRPAILSFAQTLGLKTVEY